MITEQNQVALYLEKHKEIRPLDNFLDKVSKLDKDAEFFDESELFEVISGCLHDLLQIFEVVNMPAYLGFQEYHRRISETNLAKSSTEIVESYPEILKRYRDLKEKSTLLVPKDMSLAARKARKEAANKV